MRRNEAIIDFIEKIPNGDELIVAQAAGVVALTVPNGSNYAIVQATVDTVTRFGAVATATAGVKCIADALLYLESKSELDTCSIYATAAGNLFVSYFK